MHNQSGSGQQQTTIANFGVTGKGGKHDRNEFGKDDAGDFFLSGFFKLKPTWKFFWWIYRPVAMLIYIYLHA